VQVWVVDSADRYRLDDCRRELHSLLKEEVRAYCRKARFPTAIQLEN
jgi:hypothetical protein